MASSFELFGKLLITAGITLVILGILLIYGRVLRIGSLPGDFTWSGRGWHIAVPLGTSILLSIVLTLALNLLLRRR